MSDNTKIEWTDATWNTVTGCTKISEGCTHCYIARTPPFRMAGRRFEHPEGPDRIGATTGVQLHPDRLSEPLSWRKPRRIFVCSLADVFHDDVPDEHIARVFAVMALTERHTFQVLTKRAHRMRALLSSDLFRCQVTDQAYLMAFGTGLPTRLALTAERTYQSWEDEITGGGAMPWPLPNVWLGVSAETQQRADIRIPTLLGTPAAVRWVSAEPLLGSIDLRQLPFPRWSGVVRSSGLVIDAVGGRYGVPGQWQAPAVGLDWVVAGGESGPRARPMHPEWVRDLRDQCADAGVAFHFKQWGEHDWSRKRVGKKAAGRMLDGRTHDEYPASQVESEAAP